MSSAASPPAQAEPGRLQAARVPLSDWFAHPGKLDRRDRHGVRKRIAIVGGGIAGLVAAYELERLGHGIVLFEAAERLGGRIHTHRFDAAHHAELGATRIGAHHGCVRHYLDALGLATRAFTSDNPAGLYHIGGLRCRMGQPAALWAGAAAAGGSDPDALYDAIVAETLATLNANDLHALFTATRLPGRLQALDRLAFTELFERRLDAHGFAIVGHATGMHHYRRVSALAGLIDTLNWGQGPFLTLVDGMDALPRALAARLRGPLLTGCPVAGIERRADGLALRLASTRPGAPTDLRFDYAVVTTPAPAAVALALDPPLPNEQAAALQRLPYSPSARSVALARRRRWELDDGIAGGASRTDLSIQQCWYPSDNARPGGPGEPAWCIRDPQLSATPAAFVAGYRWEQAATAFADLPATDRDAVVLRDLERLHPGIGNDIDALVHLCWDPRAAVADAADTAFGAYAFFPPGERDQIQPQLARPWPDDAPRVFFAGEHLAIAHASLQGAVQTALNAVAAVAEAPQPAARDR
jgi:monoamine oxidase